MTAGLLPEDKNGARANTDLREHGRKVYKDNAGNQRAGGSYVHTPASSQNALEGSLSTKQKPVESAVS